METQKKYKWALAGFILMILLNVAILVTLWTLRPDARDWRANRDPERGQNAVHQLMKHELGLTQMQEDSITAMRQRHFREAQQLKNQLENKRRLYFDMIMSQDENKIQKRDSLLTELTQQYLNVEESFYRHMAEMKSVLNKEQQLKFRELMKESFRNGRRDDMKRGPMHNR